MTAQELAGRAAAGAPGGWRAWDAGLVESLRKEGRVVFLDFTADWCWTCKVNEKAVLENAQVKKAFEKSGAVLLKADWTRRDPAITAALRSYGRSGVPLYVVYRGQAEPRVLPEVITPAIVVRALEGKP